MTVARTLGPELWKAIEKPQGYAFLGDDIEDCTDAEVIQRARAALFWERECVKVLRSFLRKHDSRPSESKDDA